MNSSPLTQKASAAHLSPANRWKQEPTLTEAVLIWCVAALIFVATASIFRPYFHLVRDFGDSAAYIEISTAIRSWDFSGVHVKHFWGLPYAVGVLSKLSGLSVETSLLVISSLSSLAALLLSYRLWGGWIAVFNSVLSFDWFQRAFLGGAEPLFLALLFGSFLAIRKERWYWASLLAALATTTRPLGVFLLVGIGITLLRRRQWQRLAWACGIGLSVGFLYILPLHLYLRDSLATVHSYGVLQSGPFPPLFGIPFKAIIVGTLLYPAPVSNLLLTSGWIVLVLAGNVAMFANQEFRDYAREHLPETIFLALYLLSLYAYNAPIWARSTFPRFALPILPFVLLALARWLPKDKRLLWCLAIVTPTLSACSAIGIRHVMSELHRML